MSRLKAGLVAGLASLLLVVGITLSFGFKRVSVVVTNHSVGVVRDIRIEVGSNGKTVAEVEELRPSQAFSFEFWTSSPGGWRIRYRPVSERVTRTQELDGVYIDAPGSPHVVIGIDDDKVLSSTGER